MANPNSISVRQDNNEDSQRCAGAAQASTQQQQQFSTRPPTILTDRGESRLFIPLELPAAARLREPPPTERIVSDYEPKDHTGELRGQREAAWQTNQGQGHL